MKYLFNNNASATLSVALASGDLLATIPIGDFSRFPTPSGTDFFMATLVKNSGDFEIIKVTTNNLDGTFVIERAQENTVALDFIIGDVFSHRLTKGALNTFSQNNTELQTNLNADMVDGFHASASPQANQLLALDADGDLPTDIKGDAQTLQGLTPTQLLAIGIPTIQSFTVDSIWTKPAKLKYAIIVVYAGGSGGGGGGTSGANDTNTLGGVGGDGGDGKINYGSLTILESGLSATEAVTIGAGGAGGAAATIGAVGATSSFGAILAQDAGTGGAAGATGENGSDASLTETGVPLKAADGSILPSTPFTDSIVPISNNTLSKDREDGKGGLGAPKGDNVAGSVGQAGQAGFVIVFEYY